MAKKSILVARAVFPEVLAKLSEHFEVESNQDDVMWPREEMVRRLQGKVGVLTTGGERIDAALLAACPDLKICANMAVGYNNELRAVWRHPEGRPDHNDISDDVLLGKET